MSHRPARVLFFAGVGAAIGALASVAYDFPEWRGAGRNIWTMGVVGALLGIVTPGRAWLIALGFGIWMPLSGTLRDRPPVDAEAASLTPVVLVSGALIGAALGTLVRRFVASTMTDRSAEPPTGDA